MSKRISRGKRDHLVEIVAIETFRIRLREASDEALARALVQRMSRVGTMKDALRWVKSYREEVGYDE